MGEDAQRLPRRARAAEVVVQHRQHRVRLLRRRRVGVMCVWERADEAGFVAGPGPDVEVGVRKRGFAFGDFEGWSGGGIRGGGEVAFAG